MVRRAWVKLPRTLAEKYKISREDQDTFAATSQQKASASRDKGRFKTEIIPVEIPQRKKDPIIFSDDEFIKAGTTADILSKLKPAFQKRWYGYSRECIRN